MSRKKRWIFHLMIMVVFVVLGALGMQKLIASKTQIKKRKPTAPITAVRTVKVSPVSKPVIIRGEGTVRPLREINLVPQVEGKVVYVSSALVNGGEFSNGETLLRIDPVDYQLAVILAEAKVKEAESKLELAREEAASAEEEWRMLYSGGSEGDENPPPPLVVKEPQLKAAQARLEADRAALKKALLNLERTAITAPFDGRVMQKNVDIGQYVTPGQPLATLYCTEAVEIVLPLDEEDLYWFHVPGFTTGDGPGSPATVRARIAGKEMRWTGEVVRAGGKLDERTRMINVVVRVEKPYAEKPPLAIGLFVTVDIKGHVLPGGVLIPRLALHQDNIVWVVDDNNLLRFRKVEVGRIQGESVLIKSGLKDGEIVVISSHKAITNGMAVRVLMETGGNWS